MAYSTGSATNMADLHSKIRTFALANGWVDVYYDAGITWIGKGGGDDGYDEIYIEISTYYDTGAQTWCFKISGSTGHRAGSTTLIAQYTNLGYTYVSLWDNPMGYWLCVTGRRITFVSKVATKYALGYAGFIRPLATAEQYPYPLFIGGTDDEPISWNTGSLASNCSFLLHTNGHYRGCGIDPGGSPRCKDSVSAVTARDRPPQK